MGGLKALVICVASVLKPRHLYLEPPDCPSGRAGLQTQLCWHFFRGWSPLGLGPWPGVAWEQESLVSRSGFLSGGL